MAHYAKIEDGIVTQVIVADSKEWCESNLGGTWVQTSYNTKGNQHPEGRPLHKNYAGIGFTYDSVRDAFIPPKPFASWVLNEDTCLWDAPTPMPVVEGKMFVWDEPTTAWVESVIPTPETPAA